MATRRTCNYARYAKITGSIPVVGNFLIFLDFGLDCLDALDSIFVCFSQCAVILSVHLCLLLSHALVLRGMAATYLPCVAVESTHNVPRMEVRHRTRKHAKEKRHRRQILKMKFNGECVTYLT